MPPYKIHFYQITWDHYRLVWCTPSFHCRVQILLDTSMWGFLAVNLNYALLLTIYRNHIFGVNYAGLYLHRNIRAQRWDISTTKLSCSQFLEIILSYYFRCEADPVKMFYSLLLLALAGAGLPIIAQGRYSYCHNPTMPHYIIQHYATLNTELSF